MNTQAWIDYYKNEKHYDLSEIIKRLDMHGYGYQDGDFYPALIGKAIGWTIYSKTPSFYELDNYFFSHN